MREYRITFQRRPVLHSAALLALVGAIAFVGCTRDVAAPDDDLRLSNRIANLQDENLVPNDTASNPGAVEPFETWTALDDNLPTEDGLYAWRNRLGLPPTYSQVTLRLTDPTGGTPSPSQRHTLKVKYMVWGNYSTTTPQPTLLFYELLQGSTSIAQKTVSPSGADWVIDSVNVASNLITDYNDLNIRLSLQLKPISDGMDQIQGRVAWARLEIR